MSMEIDADDYRRHDNEEQFEPWGVEDRLRRTLREIAMLDLHDPIGKAIDLARAALKR